MEAWLRQRGLVPIWVPFGSETSLVSIHSTMATHNPGVPFGVCGQSKPGVQHYIVCKDGEVACDPSGRVGEGLIGPCDDGLWWVMFLGANLS